MAQLSDDCFAFGGSLLSIDAARQMILERVTPVDGVERVRLRLALGRILAEDIAAPIAVPMPPASAEITTTVKACVVALTSASTSL